MEEYPDKDLSWTPMLLGWWSGMGAAIVVRALIDGNTELDQYHAPEHRGMLDILAGVYGMAYVFPKATAHSENFRQQVLLGTEHKEWTDTDPDIVPTEFHPDPTPQVTHDVLACLSEELKKHRNQETESLLGTIRNLRHLVDQYAAADATLGILTIKEKFQMEQQRQTMTDSLDAQKEILKSMSAVRCTSSWLHYKSSVFMVGPIVSEGMAVYTADPTDMDMGEDSDFKDPQELLVDTERLLTESQDIWAPADMIAQMNLADDNHVAATYIMEQSASRNKS